jgi:hypothetical protein
MTLRRFMRRVRYLRIHAAWQERHHHPPGRAGLSHREHARMGAILHLPLPRGRPSKRVYRCTKCPAIIWYSFGFLGLSGSRDGIRVYRSSSPSLRERTAHVSIAAAATGSAGRGNADTLGRGKGRPDRACDSVVRNAGT